MIRHLFAALVVLLAVPAQAAMVTGNGTARVVQKGPDSPAMDETVNVVAAYSNELAGKLGQRVIRLQFIRPDASAVAYAVFAFYPPGPDDRVQVGLGSTTLLYYEVRPGDNSKVFVAADVAGEMTISGRPELGDFNPHATFKFSVTDAGDDEISGTDDDLTREVFAGDVVFFAHGDLSGLYYYSDESDHVYVGGDVFLVYDDGCTGSPDSYDDDYGYDSGDYDDSYSGDSCDGDVYDDDYDDSYDSYDSYDDSSCSSDWDDDDSGDWDDDSSDWDWSDSDSDWDWDGDTYDQRGRVMRAMSWLQRPPRWLVGPLRKAARCFPLVLALVVLVSLRILGTRRAGREWNGG